VRFVVTPDAMLVTWKRVILVNSQFAATDSTLNSTGGMEVPRARLSSPPAPVEPSTRVIGPPFSMSLSLFCACRCPALVWRI
jgi:hypothetical protein